MNVKSCFEKGCRYMRGRAYATMSKVIMGKGGFYGCLSKPLGVSAWWKETGRTQTRVFVLSPSSFNQFNQAKPNAYYP